MRPRDSTSRARANRLERYRKAEYEHDIPTSPPEKEAQRDRKAEYERDIPASPADKDGRRSGKWYGAQTLAFDGLTLATIALGIEREEPFPTGVGVIGYLLATPIVHAAHGKGGRAWGSLGLRLALPAGGALVSGEDPALGAVLGAMGATLIDAIRAYDDPKDAVAPPRQTLQLSPMVGRKGTGLTFGGAF